MNTLHIILDPLERHNNEINHTKSFEKSTLTGQHAIVKRDILYARSRHVFTAVMVSKEQEGPVLLPVPGLAYG
jgi:hypothetical protein